MIAVKRALLQLESTMVSVIPFGLKVFNTQNALDLFKAQPQPTKTAAAAAAPSIESTSKARLAIIAGLIDKLIDIKSGGGTYSAASASSDEPTAEQRDAAKTDMAAAKANEDAALRARAPAEKKAWLDGLAGGGTWVMQEKPKADAATVAADLATIKQSYASALSGSPDDNAYYRGMREAAANGTLKILPTSEVPEFGYETYDATIYQSDGFIKGGAGFSKANNEFVAQQREQGVHVSAFSLDGRDYVTMWPASAEEKEKGSWAA